MTAELPGASTTGVLPVKVTPTAVRRGSQDWPTSRVRFLAWLRAR